MKTRILVTIGLALITLSVLRDPYTLYLNGSDFLSAAPRWQTSAAMLDIALLLGTAIALLRGMSRLAATLFAGELLYALAFNAILVRRDGIARFIWGFGAERHILDFVVVFGIRAIILVALVQNARFRMGRAA